MQVTPELSPVRTPTTSMIDSGPVLLPRLTASHTLAPIGGPLDREGVPVITRTKYPDSWQEGGGGQNEWVPRQRFSTRNDFARRGHSAMSRDIFGRHHWRMGVLPRPGMLLNSL